MNQPKTTKEDLCFNSFMQALGFFSFLVFEDGTYTNDDYLLYFIDRGDTMGIANHYEYPDNEIIKDVPMPKTITEALSLLPVMFNDPDFTDEDNEILNQYKLIKLIALFKN